MMYLAATVLPAPLSPLGGKVGEGGNQAWDEFSTDPPNFPPCQWSPQPHLMMTHWFSPSINMLRYI